MKNLTLFLFLLIGQQNIFAQSFLTKGEVFNYEIGDEFHYHLSRPWMFHDYYIHRVLDKYSTTTHLYYEMGNIDRANPNNILNTFLDSIPLSTLNDPIIDTTSAWLWADTICHHVDSITTNNTLLGLAHQDFFMTLNIPDNYEPPSWIQQFAKGLGEANYYRSELGGYLSIGLVYFKKDSLVWGDNVYLNAVSDLELSKKITVFPNPFKSNINIEGIEVDNFTFELYNNIGQLVLEKTIPNVININTISIPTSIPSGIYHAIIRYDKQQQVVKIIKE